MAMTLITTNTSSGAALSAFTSSIDSTYKLYIFKFHNINPDTDTQQFLFQVNAAGASGYNETITSTAFRARHKEDNSGTPALEYEAGYDQAQGTAYQLLADNIGNGGDENMAGELFLFNPSNTTYVKHFYSRVVQTGSSDELVDLFTGGYINITTAVDEISFKVGSGNFDGVIKMYGVG